MLWLLGLYADGRVGYGHTHAVVWVVTVPHVTMAGMPWNVHQMRHVLWGAAIAAVVTMRLVGIHRWRSAMTWWRRLLDPFKWRWRVTCWDVDRPDEGRRGEGPVVGRACGDTDGGPRVGFERSLGVSAAAGGWRCDAVEGDDAKHSCDG